MAKADYSEKIKELKGHQYQFENIVFEGGGAKGMAYVGVMEVLEEIGIYNQFKRFAGVSMGSVFAAMMAIGVTSKEMRTLGAQMGTNSFLDATCGFCSSLPNLLTNYGCNPGREFQVYIESVLYRHTGNKYFSFGQLYQTKKRELCILVANISNASIEYFHPKTTPKFPIAEAVGMSCSLPFLIKPRTSRLNGRKEYFVDCGILNNFPIGCFDGWYLNMDAANSFLHHDLKFENWFDPIYPGIEKKTLGTLVFSTKERELFKVKFVERSKDYPMERPDTKLSRKRGADLDSIQHDIDAQEKTRVAGLHLMTCLRKSSLDGKTSINKRQLITAMTDKRFPCEYYKTLFGTASPDEVCDQIDHFSSGQISVHTVVSYFSSRGFPIHHGVGMRTSYSVNNLEQYANSIVESIMTIQKLLGTKRSDFKRIIGINCDYVSTTDELQDEDITFLIRQGRNATISFLSDYVTENYDETYFSRTSI